MIHNLYSQTIIRIATYLYVFFLEFYIYIYRKFEIGLH
jgi:hypothetical protein